MKNENSTARRMRMQDERLEEDKRLADAAAKEAAEQAERDRLAADEKARAEADLAAKEAGIAAREAEEPAEHDRRDDEQRAVRGHPGDVVHVDSASDERVGDPSLTFPRPLQDAMERYSAHALPLWELYAKNRDAPPFHFTGVAVSVFVAAASAEAARHIAAGAAGDHGVAWLDDTQSDCVELCRTEPGLIAQDLGA